MNKGQTLIATVTISATLLGGGIGLGYLYKDVATNKDTILNHESRLSKIEDIVDDVSNLQGDMRAVRENQIRLLERFGVRPVEYQTIASTTTK